MEIGMNNLDLEPTQEELQKIRHWLASGFTRERIEFLQSITEFHLRYLDALNQQPETNNANNGDIDPQQNSSVSSISTSSLSGNEEIEPRGKTLQNVQQTEPYSNLSKEKSKHKSLKNIRPSHKHTKSRNNNRYEVSYEKEDSSFKSKSICLRLNRVIKPKLKVKAKHLQHKEHTPLLTAANSNLESVIDSNMEISEIFPTIVPINPNLGKVKVETDFVPIVGVKTEPGTGIGGDAIVNLVTSPGAPVGEEGEENRITIITEAFSEPQTIEAVQMDEGTSAPVQESVEATHDNLTLELRSNLETMAIPSQEQALKSHKILTAILTYLSTEDLRFSCSFVNKVWNKLSRQLLQQHSIIQAHANTSMNMNMNMNMDHDQLHVCEQCELQSGSGCEDEDIRGFNTLLLCFCPGNKLNVNPIDESKSKPKPCMRKLSDLLPTLKTEDLKNVREFKIYSTTSSHNPSPNPAKNSSIEVLRREFEALLKVTPKLKVINGLIPMQLLPVFFSYEKMNCVKELKVCLHRRSKKDQTETLSELNQLEQAIFKGLKLEKLKIGNLFDANFLPSLLEKSYETTFLLLQNSCSNLNSLSFKHRDLDWFFSRNDESLSLCLPRVIQLSILNYDFMMDPAGSYNMEKFLPGLKSVFIDLKNPPTRPLLDPWNPKKPTSRPCRSVMAIHVDAGRQEGKMHWKTSGFVVRKTVEGLMKSFPNVKKFIFDDENGDPEELTKLLKILLDRESKWENLEVIRLLNVALWKMKENLDSWIEMILEGNIPIKRLEVQVGKHCYYDCSNLKIFWNQRQQLVSTEFAQLVRTGFADFLVEIDSGECIGESACYFSSPSHFENLPGFLKRVKSFQD